MAKLGKKSLERLVTCHSDLQLLFKDVEANLPPDFDITVTCGHRGEKEQNEAYANGTSRLKYPHGKHNRIPSRAVDVVPYPIDWQDLNRFKFLGNFVKERAAILGIKIAWGGDWKTFKDYPHYELAE